MEPQDSMTSPAAAPLEAEVPGFAPTQRGQLDPPDPSMTVTTDSEWDQTSPGVYDPDEPFDPQLDEDLDESLPPREPTDLRSLASSSPGSTGEPDPVVANALGQLAKLGVTLASLGLNRTIGRGSGAWVMLDEEAEAIAEPLGRIGARHAPIGDGVAGDVADGIDAGLATAGYAMRATVDHQRAGTVPMQRDDQETTP